MLGKFVTEDLVALANLGDSSLFFAMVRSALHCPKENALTGLVAGRDNTTDCSHGFFLQCSVLLWGDVLGAKGQESDSESPYHLLLGCSITLDSQDVLMGIA